MTDKPATQPLSDMDGSPIAAGDTILVPQAGIGRGGGAKMRRARVVAIGPVTHLGYGCWAESLKLVWLDDNKGYTLKNPLNVLVLQRAGEA